MAFVPGFQSEVLVGSYRMSSVAQACSITSVTEMKDITVLGNGSAAGCSIVMMPCQDTSTWTASGVFDVDATVNQQYSQLDSWGTAEVPMTFGPRGLALGSELMMTNVLQSAWSISSKVTDPITWDMAQQTDGYTDLNGISLHPLTAETATVNGTEVDSGVAGGSSAGANLNLHVTAFSGFTNTVITVEHSTTSGGTYNTLATFTTVTGLTSQRLSVTGTVRRYLRIVNTKTGTGSVTFAVGLGRL